MSSEINEQQNFVIQARFFFYVCKCAVVAELMLFFYTLWEHGFQKVLQIENFS